MQADTTGIFVVGLKLVPGLATRSLFLLVLRKGVPLILIERSVLDP